MEKDLKKLIEEIKKNREEKGFPFRAVEYRKLKNELTGYLLTKKLDYLEVENDIVVLGFTNKDRTKPYTAIYSKESYKNHKDYFYDTKR